jgi:hypothetical protein
MLRIIFLLLLLQCKPTQESDIIFPNVPPMKIVQQPYKNYNWISDFTNVFTQLAQPRSIYGTKVFSIHTYGNDNVLYDLKVGDIIFYRTKITTNECSNEIYLNFYQVKEIYHYQAVQPLNPRTPLIDLETNETFSSTRIFDKLFGNNKRILFQTCIFKDGNTSWGRLFIVATKLTNYRK